MRKISRKEGITNTGKIKQQVNLDWRGIKIYSTGSRYQYLLCNTISSIFIFTMSPLNNNYSKLLRRWMYCFRKGRWVKKCMINYVRTKVWRSIHTCIIKITTSSQIKLLYVNANDLSNDNLEEPRQIFF